MYYNETFQTSVNYYDQSSIPIYILGGMNLDVQCNKLNQNFTMKNVLYSTSSQLPSFPRISSTSNRIISF